MQANDKFLDNTKISAYKDCPRKYFLRHVMNWTGTGTAMPLVFGSSWHSAMDIVWGKALPKAELIDAAMTAFAAKWEEEGISFDLDQEVLDAYSPRTPGVAEEMLHCYITARERVLRDCEVISLEGPFAVPLPGIDKTWYVGRLDKVIEYNGQRLVIEHKTTTIYKKDGGFQSAYIEGWYSDSQIKGYQFGAGLYHPGLRQVWVDCALVHKTVHDKFRFVPVEHSFPMLQEWIGDTEAWIRAMQADERQFQAAGNRLTAGCFKKNENQCFGKFGQCTFIDICRTSPDPSSMEEPPEGYKVEVWNPFDTLGLQQILDGEQTT